MKILITGSSGLVGKHLQELVNTKETFHNFFFTTSKTANLASMYGADDLFKMYEPDIVIHLASLVAGLYGNMNNNYNMFSENIKINLNILNACKKYNVKKLINVLSTCVFPSENITLPLTSNQILLGPPDESNEGYAYSKRILYNGSEILSKTTNLKVINLIPTNLYGKYDNFNINTGHVLPALIQKIYNSKCIGNTLEIKGDGSACRQFVYAKDLAQIIYDFIDYNLEKSFNNCIVCPEQNDEISIKELTNILVEKLEFEGNIVYNEKYSNGQFKKTSSNEEIKVFFPNFQFTSFSDGLDETIKHFKEHYNEMRR